MKFNIEKFKQSARPMTDSERQEIIERDANRDWLALSAKFALTVRQILRKENISQTELASRMGVSCSQITKILSGKENLGLQTIAKVEKALGRILISFELDSDEQPKSSAKPYNTDMQTISYQYACDTKADYISIPSNNNGEPG